MSKKKIILIFSVMIFSILCYDIPILSNNYNKKIFINLRSSGSWVLSSIVIDNTGGGDYTWIEAAAEDWCSGSGTWSDPFIIENITINANNTGSALLIRNSDVYFIIRNCTFYNSGYFTGEFYDAGLSLNNTKNGKIIDNDCSSNNAYGLSLDWYSDNNTVEGNIFKNNRYSGVTSRLCNNLTLSGNTVMFNDLCGMTLGAVKNSRILHNTVKNNIFGISIHGWSDPYQISENNTISDNNISNNIDTGIWLSQTGSKNNTIKNNTISDNWQYGIGMGNSSFNKILDNKIKNNIWSGIYMVMVSGYNCHDNTFFNNEIENNGAYGLFTECSDNLIYGNIFSQNSDNAFDRGTNNQWDNGTIGNFWDDYYGVDNNGDGIGESAYIIKGPSASQDNFPSGILSNSYDVPGVEEYVSVNQMIKVGLLADLNDVSGKHTWKGAYLAAKEINEAGGVLINGSIFYIGLISRNTFEYEENLDVTKGINAANNLISNYPNFIIGGTVYDAVSAYLEPVMDAKIPFINMGMYGPTENLTQKVLDNYARYKYLFQLTQNNTQISTEILTFHLYLMAYLNTNLSRTVNMISLLYEDVYYANDLIDTMKEIYSNPPYEFDIVKEIVFDSSTTKSEFENYWKEIDNAGTQFAFVMGHSNNIRLMSEAYREIKPRCLMFNLFRNTTIDTYWNDTNSKCEYEITFQALYNISRTPRSKPFWNGFLNEYGHEPTFWGAASYDSIYMIENATLDSQSLNSSKIIDSLEKINVSNPFPGVFGRLSFSSSHGLHSGLGLASELICQWRSDGTKVVLPNNNSIYYDTLATGNLQIPYWGINMHFTINSPNKNNVFDEMAPAFNIEILGTVDKIWYTLNSGSEKHFINNNGTIDQNAWMALSDGPIRLTFYFNDSFGHIYKRYVNVIKDTEPPDVTIVPLDTTTFGSEAPTIVLNIQDSSNITECYYSLDGGVTKIPFTGNEVTINQTLWDELGEGKIQISFYIIDSVGKETIVYVDVYKDLPGDDFLLYIIIGVIALGFGVMSTIAYTQYRRKKRRKTEWIKLKKKKGLISPELAEGKNLIFISYATKDSALFKIPLITEILVQYPEIDDILYWESDMHDDIYEYMDDNLKLCSVLLLFCTKKSLYSEPVKMEWRSALKLDKKIIPIFINPNDIPPLLTTKLSVQFDEDELYDSIEAIYQMLLKTLEMVSTREFCKYLIPKTVSDEYFEEQTASMVKKDIEIESDIPNNELKLQFISILEKNNFEFLKKSIDTEEIEKPESQLISLRFFAEDKFEKQEIALTVTIQKVEDYKSKVYLRVMGNKGWMVNEILSDLGSKLYPLKTVTELIREYSEKIENFMDQIDNLEEFLRKNLGSEIKEIEDLMYQYLGKQIQKDVFIKKGLQILGKRFLLVIIENLPRISYKKKDLEDRGKETDIQL